MTKHSCQNCRYKSRSVLKEPCSTGSYQLFFSKRCFVWKPRRWYQRFLDIIMSKKKRKQRLTALNTHLLLWKEVVLMDYFLAINNRQLGICLRMLFADGIQGHVETVLNEKDKIEFHIRIDTSEEIFEKLNERYEILIS